ncbi:MAG: helix-turn-helix domain-containing protein [Pseudomonadota bacterium]
MNSSRMMTPEQAAKYLGVTVGWLAKRRVDGDGPLYTKLRGRILYDGADVDDFILANKRKSTSEARDKPSP